MASGDRGSLSLSLVDNPLQQHEQQQQAGDGAADELIEMPDFGFRWLGAQLNGAPGDTGDVGLAAGAETAAGKSRRVQGVWLAAHAVLIGVPLLFLSVPWWPNNLEDAGLHSVIALTLWVGLTLWWLVSGVAALRALRTVTCPAVALRRIGGASHETTSGHLAQLDWCEMTIAFSDHKGECWNKGSAAACARPSECSGQASTTRVQRASEASATAPQPPQRSVAIALL